MTDHYQTLGVDRAADAETIRGAYLRLMKRFHPDRVGAGDERRAREINLAFAVLRNAERRERYDTELMAAREAELLQRQRREAARRRALVVQHRPPRAKGVRMGRVLLALSVLGSIAFFYDAEAWRPVTPLDVATALGVGDEEEAPAPALPGVSASVVASAVADYQWIVRTIGSEGLSPHSARCWDTFLAAPSVSLLDGCAAFDIASDFFVRGVAERTGQVSTTYFDASVRERRYGDGLQRIGARIDAAPRLSIVEGETVTAMVNGLGGTVVEPPPQAAAGSAAIPSS